jgi:hypothetical protein
MLRSIPALIRARNPGCQADVLSGSINQALRGGKARGENVNLAAIRASCFKK